MSDRSRRRAVRMTLPEAERIVALDGEGKLDRSDEAVSKVVFEAHTVVQRAAIWGGGPGQPSRCRMRLTIGLSLVFIAVWVAGLIVPLLLEKHG